jgi:hypothetical protein
MTIDRLVGGVAAIGMFALASPAAAGVIYQSIPDLTVAPTVNSFCSQCGGDMASVGEAFSIATTATAQSLLFDVDNQYVWPTSVTIGFYQDNGGSVGANLYNQTFSSFASDVPTAFGTDVVGVNLAGGVTLTPGNYLVFMTNTNSLGIPGYIGGSGTGVDTYPVSSYPLLTGDAYHSLSNLDAGVLISDSPISTVPEPAVWAMMLLGLGGVGATLRKRRIAPAAAG